MPGTGWTCSEVLGVFLTKVINRLSKMVNGKISVVKIICVINPTRSVRSKCTPSSVALFEDGFRFIPRETFAIISSC